MHTKGTRGERAMKGILQLYINMLRTLGYDTIKQCKARITTQDLCFFGIVPQQHDWKYVHQALQYIKNEGHKTTHRRKSSVSAGVKESFRQRKLDEITKRIEQAPDGAYRDSLIDTRARIEESLRLP